MKNIYLLLLLIGGNFTSLFGQEQLTHIQNQSSPESYYSAGIVNIDTVEYLIERNSISIRVSVIVDEGFQILYELSDFPLGEAALWQYGRLDTRSGYFVEENYLYEFFRKQIRKRNILTGTIENVYLFPNEETQRFISMDIVDEFFHFELDEDDSFAYYNTNTGKFQILPFHKRDTYREKNTYYVQKDFEALSAFNAEDSSTTVLFENETYKYVGTNSMLNGQKGMILGSWVSGKIRFLNADTTFILPCEFYDIITFELNIQETEEHYILISDIVGDITFTIKDKSNCANITSEFFPSDGESNTNLKIFNSPLFDEDYILFCTNYGDVFSSTQLMLYDKKSMIFFLLNDGDLRFINQNSFYRIDDEIYFIGDYPIFDTNPATLYSFDLNSKIFNSPYPYNTNQYPISFAPAEKDSTFLISINYDGIIKVHEFKDRLNIKLIYTPEDEANQVLGSLNYLAIHEEKMIFKVKNEIYLVDNNSNSNEKVSLITNVSNISNLLIDDNWAQGLANNNDTTYYLKYDHNSNALTQTALDVYVEDLSKSFAFSKYIFASFSLQQKIYFDLELENYRSIPISEHIISIHNSNENILFLTTNNSSYSLTSFTNDEFVNLPTTFSSKPEIFSKNNGEFFILENSIGTNNQISVLKSDGSLGNQIIVSGTKLTINQVNIENGPLSAFMFYNPLNEELELIMHQNDSFNNYSIPFKNASSLPITWYKAGNSIVLKSDDENERGIYVFTLDKEPRKLELNDVGFTDYNLLFATHDEYVISFMVDSDIDDLEIVQYNTETGNITKPESDIFNVNYESDLINTTHQLSPYNYYVSIPLKNQYGEIENNELRFFNSSNTSFQYTININQRPQISNPHRFISSPTHLYFISRSPQDNSYQLFTIEKDAITSVPKESTVNSNLRITPNPSSNFISIAFDIDILKIQDIHGKELMTLKNYNANDKIDISGLEDSAYFITSIIHNKWSTSQFIKI